MLSEHRREMQTTLSSVLMFLDEGDVTLDQLVSGIQDTANEFDNSFVLYTTLADLTINASGRQRCHSSLFNFFKETVFLLLTFPDAENDDKQSRDTPPTTQP